MADEQPSLAGTRLGKYVLARHLAIGGMAEVWIARQEGLRGLERIVVVKVIIPEHERDLEFRKLFIDEARTVSRLNHPNIVRILEVGAGARNFIAMELILGENLQTLRRKATARGVRIPIGIACRIVSDACKGLHHAHTRTSAGGKPLGIIHRDVSPQNVMVTYEGQVKIVDFGIAKAADRLVRTKTGMVRGKWRYMSPEQARGTTLDPRADVFSAGAVLFELCTGSRLYETEDPGALIQQVASCAVRRPRAVNPLVPEALERIIMRALEAQRESRYATAQELGAELDAFAASADLFASSDEVARFISELCAEEKNEKVRACHEVYLSTRPAPKSELSELEITATIVEAIRVPADEGADAEPTIPEAPREDAPVPLPEDAISVLPEAPPPTPVALTPPPPIDSGRALAEPLGTVSAPQAEAVYELDLSPPRKKRDERREDRRLFRPLLILITLAAALILWAIARALAG